MASNFYSNEYEYWGFDKVLHFQLYQDNDEVSCQMQSILVQLFSFQLKLLLSRPPAHLFIIITMFLSMYKFNAVWRSVERATFIRFCFNRTPRLFASFCHFHDIGNINNDQSSHLHSSHLPKLKYYLSMYLCSL